MTPDALRAAIASARLRPRMYGATTADLAAYLHGLVAGAFGGGGDTVRDAWATASAGIAWRVNSTGPALAAAEVCDVALRVVAALWPQGDAAPRGFRDGEAPAPQVIADNARAEMDRLADDDPALASAWGDVERAALALVRREGAPAQPDALDLDAIEARAAAASAGPWASRLGPHAIPEVHGPKYGIAFTFYGEDEGENDRADADAAFIAAARTDVPALAAALRASRAEVAALRANIADGERIAAEVRGLFAHVDDDAPPPVGFDDLFADAPVEDDNDAAQLAALARREGEAFAAQHPHAAGAMLGGVAHREDVNRG